ncbi:Regulator of chromosome condensation [Armadillidium nasatum]|uniref:Regulator of chromosome condensation n=1 Tax=Armadillidium nasatum TaxID=96803 RepID=A0A5N5SQH7_9CRUS|nr:Regulator of chromosome condensation [Armadillidium nasatum]
MAHAKNTKSHKTSKSEAKVNGISNKNMKSSVRGRKRTQNEVADPPSKKLKVELKRPNIEDGVVLTVGTGDVGQLGLGPEVEEKTRPGTVPNMKNVVAVAAGGLHSLCLTKDGRSGLGRITSTEEENFEIGEVKLDGEAVQICAGDCHSAALMSDGRVFAWGSFRDNSGPLGFIEQGTLQKLPRQIMEGIAVTKISSGNNHLVLLTHSGYVYTCGCGESGQLGRIAEVFANRNIRNRNGTENLLEPHPLKVYKSRKHLFFDDIWAGGYSTFVKVESTGDIYGFGLNNYCQLGDEDINMKFQPVLLKSFQGKRWKQISPGQHHSIALDEDGVVYSMGRNEYGRLGLGQGSKDATKPTPIPLPDVKPVFVAAGECVSFIVTKDGEVYGFGMGTNNQLAQGDDEDRWEPSIIKGKQLEDKKVVSVEAGGQHTIFLAVPK